MKAVLKNDSTIILPLTSGERPLFGALPMLECAYRDYKTKGNEFVSLDESKVFKQITELYTIAEILISRNSRGLRNTTTDLYEMLQKLPLFFNTEQVYQWEVKKVWNSNTFIPHKEILIAYENSFNTMNISSVYQVTPENTHNSYIWQQWFLKTDIKQIVELIESSAKRLFIWNSHRKEKTHLQKNLYKFSKYINIDKNITNDWYYLYVLGQQHSNVWDAFLKEFGNENSGIETVHQLLAVWESALDLKYNALNSLTYSDSTLVNLGFLNNEIVNIKSWGDVWKKMNTLHIPNINNKLMDANNILNIFLQPINNEDVLPIEWFSYIKNIDNIANIVKNIRSGRVLIYGSDSSGKKSLVFSLLNHCKYDGYCIKPSIKEEENKNKKMNELVLADRLLEKINNSALVVTDGENDYDLSDKKLLMKNHSLQIWIIGNLKDVNKKFLNSFDFVYEMELPPLNGRLELATKLFEDKNTAFRIAQSVKEPSKIIKIGKLCHLSNNFSWDYISTLMYSFKKLHRNEENRLNLNKLEVDNNIVNLVGYPVLKEALDNLVQFYKFPELYSTMGAKANKGILLVGPPGTGKTHFARNLSKIVNLPIFAPDTSVLANKLELMSDLFVELKMNAPCILFLDEIDTLIANPKEFGGVNLEKQKIVNTFLSHIDGIENNDGILIVGATHRSDNFDPAAVRSGRLSKVIHLTMPNEKAREEIWKEHLKNKKVDESLNIKELLKLSVGFSCADIMDATNKSAILAVEKGLNSIGLDCLKTVCDEVFWGYYDPSMVINERQKEITAYHEAGHALVALYYGYNVPRITIRPRQTNLGATHIVNDEGIFNMSKEDVKKRLQINLGGICAEKLIFGCYENGGSQDLSSSKKLVSNSLHIAGLGREGAIQAGDPNTWSDGKKVRLENEEIELMSEQFNKTEDILENNKQLLIEIAESLLLHKEISGDIMEYFKSKIKEPNLSLKQKVSKENHVLHSNK